MKKRIMICGILLILCVLSYVLYTYVFSKKEVITPDVPSTEVIDLNSESTESEVDSEISNEVTPSESTDEVEEIDRTLVFDNIVTEVKDKDSYIGNDVSIEDVEGYDVNSDVVDKYEFSSGFVLRPTDNTELYTHSFQEGILIGKDGTEIDISELNPDEVKISSLREELLTESGFSYYLTLKKDLSLESNTIMNVGLDGWEEYFGNYGGYDPTINDDGQIICDTEVDTAFGKATFIELYSKDFNAFFGYAFIKCDGNRLLKIVIKSDSTDYLYSYLLEVTNDSITLIE